MTRGGTVLGTLQAFRVRFPRLRSHTYNLRAPLCSTMSRLMLALGLGALAGASAFERAAPTFELRAATVPKVGSLAAAPGGPLCNICEQLADQVRGINPKNAHCMCLAPHGGRRRAPPALPAARCPVQR